MTDFTYTKEWYPRSSVIEGVLYNENHNYVVLDVNDSMYKYTNVSKEDVLALVTADSVGAYYNTTFKQKFGPSEYLGEYEELDWDNEEVIAKDEPTKEYSLASAPTAPFESSSTFTGTVVTEPTKEFSLRPVEPVKVVDPEGDEFDVTSTVYFVLGDDSKVYEFASNKFGLEEAIGEVNDFVTRVSAKGRVVKVVFEFE